MNLKPYSLSDEAKWDVFCNACLNSTFLHTRKFLNYHREKFTDKSLLIQDGGRIIGLLPAATRKENPDYVISHPGITYGGIVHCGQLYGRKFVEAIELIREYYSQISVGFLYKTVPSYYHSRVYEDDRYALHINGAKLSRVDLSSAINLKQPVIKNQLRKRKLKKALTYSLKISYEMKYLENFWEVLTINLVKKYGVQPTHSLNEINKLIKLFPENIIGIFAIHGSELVAGILLFSTKNVDHAQYIAASDIGLECSALDLIFQQAIENAIDKNKLWFDFGVSTEKDGLYLNSGLYDFKMGFGSGGLIHEFYEFNFRGP